MTLWLPVPGYAMHGLGSMSHVAHGKHMGAGDGHMGSTWEQVMGTWEAHASR